MKYNITVLVALLIAVMLFGGCNNDKDKEWGNPSADITIDENSTQIENNSNPTAEITAIKSPELEALRTQIANEKAIAGVALVDYVDSSLSEKDIEAFLYNDPLTEKYPFLKNAKTVPFKGQELFVIVPSNDTGIITVYESKIDDSLEYIDNKNEPIYVGSSGEIVALRCNESENFSNILIKITDNGKECEIRPSISLEDGRTVVGIDGCYDFTLDDMRKHTDEAYYLLSNYFPEIADAENTGKTLVSMGLFWFSDQYMIRFELGTYTDDGFKCENQYAVSFDATYSFDYEKNAWYVYGVGINSLKNQPNN